MLLVEHLKRKACALVSVKTFCQIDGQVAISFLHSKVMVAHTAFTEATDLLLKSHAWLVKDPMLGTHRKPCLFGSMYETQFAAAKTLHMILPASSYTMIRKNVFSLGRQDSLLADKFAECSLTSLACCGFSGFCQ